LNDKKHNKENLAAVPLPRRIEGPSGPRAERPSWEEYFFQIANQVATRSTCLRRQVGAVIVKDKRILATGYNGAPKGLVHCLDVGCLREEMGIPSGQRHELCRALHAEQNAIAQAALHGVKIEGATVYVTHQPCSLCAKMIINTGIVEVYFDEGYPDELSAGFFAEAGIKVHRSGQK
jgi:dCMP deaminase